MRWVWLVFVAACGSKSDPMTTQLAQAWQGTWVLPLHFDIVEVRGTSATYWDRDRGKSYGGAFEIVAPCLARVGTDPDSPKIHFAFDGALWIGARGVRVGDAWHACPFNDVVVEHSSTECRMRGAKKLRCELTATHLELAFESYDTTHERKLAIHGIVLRGDFPPEQPYRASSLEDAQQHSREHNLAAAPVSGERLYQQRGCVACHTVDGSPKIGPSFKGSFGTTVKMDNGDEIAVDEAYLRESITAPNGKARSGFPPTCIDAGLTIDEVDRIVEFIKSLR